MIITLAFRNLLRHRRRSILTGLTMLAGFVVLAFSLGLTEGGYDRIIQTFTDLQTGHVQVLRRGYIEQAGFYKTIPAADTLSAIIHQQPEVSAVAARIEAGALVYHGGSTAGAELIGVDPIAEPKVSSILERLSTGQWLSASTARQAVLGNKLASQLQLQANDSFAVIAQGADGSTSTDMFTAIGILRGNAFDDYRLYTDLATLDEFLGLQGRRHRIVIKGDSFKHSQQLQKTLEEALPLSEDLGFYDWRQVESDFVVSMEADKSGNYILYVIIGLVVALGVLNTVLMSLLERRREFGVLKALGTKPAEIFSLIMLEVSLLSLISCLGGSLVAWLLNSYLAKEGIQFPEPVEFGGIFIDEMVSTSDLSIMLTPTFLVLACALIAAFIPAWQASTMKASDAMRSR